MIQHSMKLRYWDMSIFFMLVAVKHPVNRKKRINTAETFRCKRSATTQPHVNLICDPTWHTAYVLKLKAEKFSSKFCLVSFPSRNRYWPVQRVGQMVGSYEIQHNIIRAVWGWLDKTAFNAVLSRHSLALTTPMLISLTDCAASFWGTQVFKGSQITPFSTKSTAVLFRQFTVRNPPFKQSLPPPFLKVTNSPSPLFVLHFNRELTSDSAS